MPTLTAISISKTKGVRKENINSVQLIKNFGLENDGHGGKWHRQVSLLAQESIETMRDKGLDVVAGNFAENLTTTGIDLTKLQVGDHLKIGESELIISQKGKVCHKPCAIYYQAGDCVMPKEGIFAVVARGGEIGVGNTIEVLGEKSRSAALIALSNDIKDFSEECQQALCKRHNLAFVRVDALKKAEDLDAVLEDLQNNQNCDQIYIYNPKGELPLRITAEHIAFYDSITTLCEA